LRTRDHARRAEAVADRAGAQVRESQRRHRIVSTLAPVGLFETDADGAVAYVNPRWCELTGLAPHEAWGDGWTAAFDLRGCDHLLAAWTAAVAGGREFQADLPLGPAAPTARWVSVATRPVHDASGAVTGHLGTATDITALKSTEGALREAEELLRGAFEDAPIGMLLTDLDGRVQQANDAFAELVGRAPDELPGSDWVTFLHPQEAGDDVVAAADLLTGRTDVHVREARLRHRSGDTVWVSLHVTVVRGADDRPLSFLAQVQDVTERRRFEGRLQHMADHDPLTGLLNRRRFEEELDRQVAHVRRYGDSGALLVLDLDHFKLVNDTLGHTIGDEVIAAVADLLRRRLRQTDLIARLGGDEFAVLLPQATAEEAARVADALVTEVRSAAMVVRGVRNRRVTASLGVAMFERPVEAGEEVLVNADLAMYDAKEAGRDGWALYASERHAEPRMKARVAWVERIHQALEEDRLLLEAQPIRDLASGEVTQYELLLRMRDEQGEIIPPAAFLAVAERYDLITDIDRWVASRAIELLHEHPGVTFEINVSGKSLNDPLLLETIETGLQISGVEASRLVVEVTETAAVANIAEAREFAERLARLGCRFALDDFGSGFGSFYYLKHLPFDYLKIDGEFVSGCLRSQTDQLVIEAVVRIARGLGKVTVAEFVGDEETERFLRDRGVDLAQGFHVGRPMPLDQLAGVGA
ncbi:MAG TPA: EAL domain-containing protein, partial [Baekduia sp.]|nr:EAL domain-containing protein [Baekduia sp.]